MQYLLLTPGQEPEVRTQDEALTYDQMVAAVGYPIEMILLRGASMYVCEEGKAKNFPVNVSAMLLAGDRLQAGDFIVGTALIAGPVGAGGTTTSLPDQTRDTYLDWIKQPMPVMPSGMEEME